MTTLTPLKELTENNYNDLVAENNRPVIVDCYAEWCTHCPAMEAILQQLVGEFPDIEMVKLDTVLQPTIAQIMNPIGLPTLVMFKDGKEVAKYTENQNKDNVRKWIKGCSL